MVLSPRWKSATADGLKAFTSPQELDGLGVAAVLEVHQSPMEKPSE